jgi:hypothetical protein
MIVWLVHSTKLQRVSQYLSVFFLNRANSLNGEVRSFNGDSVLAFFMGNDSNAIDSAIKAAMQIKYLMLIDENCLKNKVLKSVLFFKCTYQNNKVDIKDEDYI